MPKEQSDMFLTQCIQYVFDWHLYADGLHQRCVCIASGWTSLKMWTSAIGKPPLPNIKANVDEYSGRHKWILGFLQPSSCIK